MRCVARQGKAHMALVRGGTTTEQHERRFWLPLGQDRAMNTKKETTAVGE